MKLVILLSLSTCVFGTSFKDPSQTAVYDLWLKQLNEPAYGYHKKVPLSSALSENRINQQADNLITCIIHNSLKEDSKSKQDAILDRKDASQVLDRVRRGFSLSRNFRNLRRGVKKAARVIHRPVQDVGERLEEAREADSLKERLEEAREADWLKERLEETREADYLKERLEQTREADWLKERLEVAREHGEQDLTEQGRKIKEWTGDKLEQGYEDSRLKTGIAIVASALGCESGDVTECEIEIIPEVPVVDKFIDILKGDTKDAFKDAIDVVTQVALILGMPKTAPLIEHTRIKRDVSMSAYLGHIEYDIWRKLDPIKNKGFIDPAKVSLQLATLSNNPFPDYNQIFYNGTYIPEFRTCFRTFYSSLDELITERFNTLFPGLYEEMGAFCSKDLTQYKEPLPTLCKLFNTISKHGITAGFDNEIPTADKRTEQWELGQDTIGYFYYVSELMRAGPLTFDKLLKAIVESKNIHYDY